MSTFAIQVIKDHIDYEAAVERIGELFDASPGTVGGDELQSLLHMVDTYQKEKALLLAVGPEEVIRFMMQQRGLEFEDIAHCVGGQDIAGQILSSKISLTPQMLSALSTLLHIPIAALV